MLNHVNKEQVPGSALRAANGGDGGAKLPLFGQRFGSLGKRAYSPGCHLQSRNHIAPLGQGLASQGDRWGTHVLHDHARSRAELNYQVGVVIVHMTTTPGTTAKVQTELFRAPSTFHSTWPRCRAW